MCDLSHQPSEESEVGTGAHGSQETNHFEYHAKYRAMRLVSCDKMMELPLGASLSGDQIVCVLARYLNPYVSPVASVCTLCILLALHSRKILMLEIH